MIPLLSLELGRSLRSSVCHYDTVVRWMNYEHSFRIAQ